MGPRLPQLLAPLFGQRSRLPLYVLGLLLCAVMLPMAGLPGCRTRPAVPEPMRAPAWHAIEHEPTIRVRIRRHVPHARLTSSGPLWFGPRGQRQQIDGPVTLRIHQGALIVQPDQGQAYRWRADRVEVQARDQRINVDGTPYPGTLWVHLVQPDDQPMGLDVVNHVAMEAYLPGVLHRELYQSWHIHAFRAQAVAARSYALYQAGRATGRHYDVESTTASQVYGGAQAHARARQAVADTAGIVLTYGQRVLPGFYSSACGGTGQSAAAAFGDAGDLPPLQGRTDGSFCAASSYHRWGPIVRDRDELTKRLAAWGNQHEHRIASLTGIDDIQVIERTPIGRPTRFAIIDHQGQTLTLMAESFRFACNSDAPGLPAVTPSEQLRSSHVTPRVVGQQVRFEDGRGYGHGVGLCQWGAQGMALQGYMAEAILAMYYPGASLRKLY